MLYSVKLFLKEFHIINVSNILIFYTVTLVFDPDMALVMFYTRLFKQFLQ